MHPFLRGRLSMLQGRILALDSKAARLKLLESAARKQRMSSMVQTVACQLQDLQQHHPEAVPLGGFDRVLVDAPCSGTGTLAKRADLRWQRLPEHLPQLCTLQVSLWYDVLGLLPRTSRKYIFSYDRF